VPTVDAMSTAVPDAANVQGQQKCPIDYPAVSRCDACSIAMSLAVNATRT